MVILLPTMRLLCIHSLVLFCILNLSVADLRCHKCLWTAQLLEDSCSPVKFNESAALRMDQCRFGCIITAIYMSGSMSSYSRACSLKYVERHHTCVETLEGTVKEVNCFCGTDLCNGLNFGMETLNYSSGPYDVGKSNSSRGLAPIEVSSHFAPSGSPMVSEMTTTSWTSTEKTMDYHSSSEPPPPVRFSSNDGYPPESSRDNRMRSAINRQPPTSRPINGGDVINLSRWSLAFLLFTLCAQLV